MLTSMTGFGEAQSPGGGSSGEGYSPGIHVELRSVNHRHLNLSIRGPEPYPRLEAEIEKVIRRTVKRGSVSVLIRVDRRGENTSGRLNADALVSYVRQIEDALQPAGMRQYVGIILTGLLQLPGVAEDPGAAARPSESEWARFEAVLNDAVGRLQQMRRGEGQAMAAELTRLAGVIRSQLDAIAVRAPLVAASYRDRLRERIAAALAEESVRVADEHLIREVALFADRCDVNEELARLASHLQQFGEIVSSGDDSPGRKLEFVAQEMGREANTIGSKAADAAVSRAVVEVKSALEKIRELIQNVE